MCCLLDNVYRLQLYLLWCFSLHGIRVVSILLCKGKAAGRMPSIAVANLSLILPEAFRKSQIWVFHKIITVYLSCPSLHAFVAGM